METPSEGHHDVGEGSGSSAIDFRGLLPGQAHSPQPTYVLGLLSRHACITRFLDKMQI